jgi:hypothetical protein
MSPAIKTIIFELSEVLIAGLCEVEETLSPHMGIRQGNSCHS